MLKGYAAEVGVPGIAPHDLRRRCAKLCRAAGGELEQIQMLLGHAPVQTTERYLGTRQDLVHAPNDAIRLRVRSEQLQPAHRTATTPPAPEQCWLQRRRILWAIRKRPSWSERGQDPVTPAIHRSSCLSWAGRTGLRFVTRQLPSDRGRRSSLGRIVLRKHSASFRRNRGGAR